MTPEQQQVMFSSDDNSWRTPRWLFDALNRVNHYKVDVASDDANHLCRVFYTEKDDALSHPWTHPWWCNPPYGRSLLPQFISKAAHEAANGHHGTLLVPSRTETGWFNLAWTAAHKVTFIVGRLHFLDANGNVRTAAPFPSVLFEMGGDTKKRIVQLRTHAELREGRY